MGVSWVAWLGLKILNFFLSQLNFFSDIIRDEIASFFDQHLPFLMIMLFFSKKKKFNFFSENCEETERRLFYSRTLWS